MRLWYLVMGVAAVTVFGSWFAITDHLAAAGIDVLYTRIAAGVLGFFPLVVVSAEETVIAVRSKLEHTRMIRARTSVAEAGQVSVAIGPGEGALSAPPKPAPESALALRPPAGQPPKVAPRRKAD